LIHLGRAMGFKLVYFMRKHECAWWSGVDGGCPLSLPTTYITSAAEHRHAAGFGVKTRSGAAKRDCTTHVAADTPPRSTTACICYSQFPSTSTVKSFIKNISLCLTTVPHAGAEYKINLVLTYT